MWCEDDDRGAKARLGFLVFFCFSLLSLVKNGKVLQDELQASTQESYMHTCPGCGGRACDRGRLLCFRAVPNLASSNRGIPVTCMREAKQPVLPSERGLFPWVGQLSPVDASYSASVDTHEVAFVLFAPCDHRHFFSCLRVGVVFAPPADAFRQPGDVQGCLPPDLRAQRWGHTNIPHTYIPKDGRTLCFLLSLPLSFSLFFSLLFVFFCVIVSCIVLRNSLTNSLTILFVPGR